MEDDERLTVSISPIVVAETGTATGIVTRGNTDSGAALTVLLASSDTGQATVPASVTIPANQPSATFTITGVDDGLADGTQSVTITVTATGYAGAAQSVAVTDLGILRLSALPASISENGGQATATLTRSNVELGAELTVTLTSSDPGEASRAGVGDDSRGPGIRACGDHGGGRCSRGRNANRNDHASARTATWGNRRR